MTIFGPLVAPTTSAVTNALSRVAASDVIESPSTTSTTGRVSESPAAVATLSISMTSPTATFCCLAPARTIAYTAVSFVDTLAYVVDLGHSTWAPHRTGTPERTEDQYYGSAARTPKRAPASTPVSACAHPSS